jgi:hypothetical protein
MAAILENNFSLRKSPTNAIHHSCALLAQAHPTTTNSPLPIKSKIKVVFFPCKTQFHQFSNF